MYSRQEVSALKQGFWTAFGQYMAPVKSAEGERVNWINYKTGERDIAFRMDADNRKAFIGIEIRNKDIELQQLYFEQMTQFRTLFQSIVQEEWVWQLHGSVEGRTVSRIFCDRPGLNVLDRADWPELISFFKPRIIALDAFWSNVKYAFEGLL